MKTIDLENYIDKKVAPNNLQESYDNSGLIIGAHDKIINKALICLDITEEVMVEAKNKGCDIVISHHPILFKALKRFNESNYTEKIVSFAIKNDISIYSLHTNLDNVYFGVNHKICDLMSLRQRDIIRPKDEDGKVGAGMLGRLENPLNAIDFVKKVKNNFNAGAVKYTKPIKTEVRKIAVCGGSGSFLLNDAINAGADVFITSDFTYHQFFDAEDKIMIIDVGHYEFEQYTEDLIYNLLDPLTRQYDVEFFVTSTNTNPVNYI